jgi:DNA processing protein
MNEQRISQIALTSIPNIGDVTAKNLMAYCGAPELVFKEKRSALEKIPGIGIVNANSIIRNKDEAFRVAEEELKFVQQNNISLSFYLDEDYPTRLFHCEDSPILLYGKGNINLNKQKIISVVGTRRATEYGIEMCEQIIKELVPHDPIIVSGLAYGIDIAAHKNALINGLSTVGVLAHGLDRLYPQQHRSTANKMLETGGLLTEFKSNTNPDRENFPKRNRIVAGISDLTLVIESSKKGGSLITADLAHNYNRDVFALPGKVSDEQSEGCNWLVKTNKAALIQSAKDIEYIMGWDTIKNEKPIQTKMFDNLTENQQKLVDVLSRTEKLPIDKIALNSKLTMSQTSAILLELEFKGLIKTFPGKTYKLL